ncbi:translation factor Guf1, mitochondrial-like [Dendronephthya gigantea]|uniref:translation factor Guf1, mitochondrial-like n=1 Tax=Dendronephthya gigantea TaxID=151771 RepID=UPI00106C932F|nr:translation factor Guf1, mitochondrial-like [Dendronephthya gigantea]
MRSPIRRLGRLMTPAFSEGVRSLKYFGVCGICASWSFETGRKVGFCPSFPGLNFSINKSSLTSSDDGEDISMANYPNEMIRNFCIIAHIDHGKSTLADRLLEFTGTISKNVKNKQVLDKLQVERERGITVKAQTASLFYEFKNQKYLLNLVDTPGHVDFSYEVSRSLAACQGVVLLVDAVQGVQAQTVANFFQAFDANLMIIPVINKIDVSSAKPDQVSQQMESVFDVKNDEIIQVSAKEGWGVEELLEAVIKRIPCPTKNSKSPLKCLVFDSWYDRYRGIICLVAVIQGKIKKGDKIMTCNTNQKYDVLDLGILHPDETSTGELYVGQIGYIVTGMKNSDDAQIGETFCHVDHPASPLKGFKAAKPMVFAGFYPVNQSDFLNLRNAVEKLTLNDASVSVHRDSSAALGQGMRLGFLGILHMEVFRERLEQEYQASVVVTSPSVPFKATLRNQNKREILIMNASEFPESSKVEEYLEPFVLGTIIMPQDYLGKVMTLCQKTRGEQHEIVYIDDTRLMMKYFFPLSEIILDFYDQLKSVTSGYASFDYEDAGYRQANLVKLDFYLNGNLVDALSTVVNADKSQEMGKSLCLKLQKLMSRQLFEVAIQAKVGGKIIARQSLKALRKDVTAKLYGGDMTRRRKLLDQQKEGKKKMRRIGNIDVPHEVFLSLLKK